MRHRQVGAKWPANPGVKAPKPAKAKSKAKAETEDAPKGG